MHFYLGDYVTARQLMEAAMEAKRSKLHLAKQAEVSRFVVDGIAVISRIWIIYSGFDGSMEAFSQYKEIALRANVWETQRLQIEKLYVRMQQAYQDGSGLNH